MRHFLPAPKCARNAAATRGENRRLGGQRRGRGTGLMKPGHRRGGGGGGSHAWVLLRLLSSAPGFQFTKQPWGGQLRIKDKKSWDACSPMAPPALWSCHSSAPRVPEAASLHPPSPSGGFFILQTGPPGTRGSEAVWGSLRA